MRCIALTPSARRWLTHTTSARVLNVFDRACNLVNQESDLLALVTSERGLNPFAMLVDSDDALPFRNVSTTNAVTVSANHLTVGSLRVEIELAQEWNPIPDWPAVRQRLAAESGWLNVLVEQAMQIAPAGSLLELFNPLSLAWEGFESPMPVGTLDAGRAPTPLLQRAGQGAIDLVSGLRGGSMEQSMLGAKRLAGLGGGLTPAGDDFIVGVLLAIWAGLYGSEVLSWCKPIAEATAPLTTTLSAAYLRAAARGACMFYWHSLLDALCRKDPADLRLATCDLLSIGHTSGADALAGFLTHHLTHRS